MLSDIFVILAVGQGCLWLWSFILWTGQEIERAEFVRPKLSDLALMVLGGIAAQAVVAGVAARMRLTDSVQPLRKNT